MAPNADVEVHRGGLKWPGTLVPGPIVHGHLQAYMPACEAFGMLDADVASLSRLCRQMLHACARS